MSPIALVPTKDLLWDFYVAGPFLNNAAVATTFSDFLIGNLTPFITENQIVVAPRPIWEHSQGGAGVIQVGARHKGVLCMAGSTTVVALINGMGGLSFWPIVDITGLDPAFRQPSWRRVQWLTLNLAMDVGTLDNRTGVLMASSGGAQSAPIWPVAPSIAWGGGAGVVGDGAGNWNWESFDNSAPPATVLESVSLAPAIADASDWHTFDFVYISGAGGREAAFQLFIDNVLFLARDWVNAPTMQPLAAAATRYFPIWQVGTISGDVMYFGDWEYRAGRFLPDGRELLK